MKEIAYEVFMAIDFKGRRFAFAGDENRTVGAILTEEEYRKFDHRKTQETCLCADGKIRRCGVEIGERKDIRWPVRALLVAVNPRSGWDRHTGPEGSGCACILRKEEKRT